MLLPIELLDLIYTFEFYWDFTGIHYIMILSRVSDYKINQINNDNNKVRLFKHKN